MTEAFDPYQEPPSFQFPNPFGALKESEEINRT
jgi:hypothetical protein